MSLPLRTAARLRIRPSPPTPDPAVADSLQVIIQPSGAVDDVVLTQQPVVRVLDQYGAPFAANGVTITASKQSGSGTLIGTLTANTNGSGEATFATLEIQGTGSHVLAFAAAGLTGVQSTSFTVDAAPAPNPGTVIAAETWRWDGNTGSVKVSSGFPMQPGQLSDSNLAQVRVYVDSVEQAVALSPLRGKFPDGSYRSLGIQFVYTLTNNTPVAAEVQLNAGARGTVDIAWEEPVYDAANTAVASATNRAVIAPTDAAHKCASFVTFVPLQPEADDTANTTCMGTSAAHEFGEWADALKNTSVGSPLPGLASYGHVDGLFAGWQRSTGAISRQFYQWAFDRLFDQMRGTTTNSFYWVPGVNSASYPKVAGVDTTLGLNPNQSGAALSPEWHSGIYLGWASGYLVTAWKQPWRLLSLNVSHEWHSTTYSTMDTRLSNSSGGMRMHSWRALCLIAAQMVEATMTVPGGFGPGRVQGTALFATQIPWILDVWAARAYSGYVDPLRGGAGADGIVGQRQVVVNCAHQWTGSTYAGHFPLFQLMTVIRVLHLLHNNNPVDGRTAGMVKTIADFLLSQASDDNGFFSWDYELALPMFVTPLTGNHFYAAMYRELFGLAYALETDPTDKATYLTALDKCLNRNIHNGENKYWKQFGEHFHSGHHSALYYRGGGTVRGIAGVHPTTIVEPPAHTS